MLKPFLSVWCVPAAFYHVLPLSGNGELVKSGESVYNTAPPVVRIGAGGHKLERKLSLEPKLAEQPPSPEVQRMPTPRRRLTIVLFGLSAFVILFFAFLPPAELMGKADMVGYAICHRIPERSFFLGERPFPLCARCTGTFLGAVLGLTAMLLLRRWRASRLPSPLVLGALVLFVGFWGFDGLNSYLTLFPGAPNLYEPRNWLRMTTGLLNGLALMIFVFPIFNFTIWRDPDRVPAIKNIWELLALLPAVAVLVLAVHSELSIVLYALALLSSVGVVLMLVLINSMIAAVVLGREGYAQTWAQALPTLTVGGALAILQMTAMVLLRAYLTAELGLPF